MLPHISVLGTFLLGLVVAELPTQVSSQRPAPPTSASVQTGPLVITSGPSSTRLFPHQSATVRFSPRQPNPEPAARQYRGSRDKTPPRPSSRDYSAPLALIQKTAVVADPLSKPQRITAQSSSPELIAAVSSKLQARPPGPSPVYRASHSSNPSLLGPPDVAAKPPSTGDRPETARTSPTSLLRPDRRNPSFHHPMSGPSSSAWSDTYDSIVSYAMGVCNSTCCGGTGGGCPNACLDASR